MYDATVFDKIRTLVPSGRGELEITDVNNAYIREGTMTFSSSSTAGGPTRGRSNRCCAPRTWLRTRGDFRMLPLAAETEVLVG